MRFGFLQNHKKNGKDIGLWVSSWVGVSCHEITHLSVAVEEAGSCVHGIHIYIATSGLGLNTWQELYLIFISFGSLA